MEKFKKKHYIIAGVILLFVITNPSRDAFVSYLGKTDNEGTARKFNGILFSLYLDNSKYYKNYEYIQRHNFYIGILGNFIKTPRK